jgi:hypothetical protein
MSYFKTARRNGDAKENWEMNIDILRLTLFTPSAAQMIAERGANNQPMR